MSFCRFGPGSDVYAYEDVYGGITIHVASLTRGEWWECPRPELTGDSEAEVQAFLASWNKRMAWCESHPGLPIGLPKDGETWNGDYVDAMNYLYELRAWGYLVPQYAIEALWESTITEPGEP